MAESSTSTSAPSTNDAQTETQAPAADSHPYTLETLKQHGSRESMWMLLHDKVYDVTKFMDEVSVMFSWLHIWGWIDSVSVVHLVMRAVVGSGGTTRRERESGRRNSTGTIPMFLSIVRNV